MMDPPFNKFFTNQINISINPNPNPNGDVQLSPLPVSFHKSVGGETPVGKAHLDGHPLTRFTVGVNKTAGATVSVLV